MCEGSLICDLAETYGIYDYRGLSPVLVATLLFGLRENSRVKMELSGQKITLEQMLLAIVADNTAMMFWSQTEDAKKGRHRPESILKKLLGKEEEHDFEVFATLEEFEETYLKILEEKQNGN